MPEFAEPLARLIAECKRLPGIGQKSAQRIAFHLLRAPREDAERLAQALFDEDFGTRHYPEWFRREKIDEHLASQGAYCGACDRRVRIADLTLDHIVPWAAGGLTSRHNARVICRRCNSSKQDRAGIFDYVRGRSG